MRFRQATLALLIASPSAAQVRLAVQNVSGLRASRPFWKLPVQGSDTTAQRVYEEREVAKPAARVRGSKEPRYPRELRDKGITGRVIARFVIDTTGRMIASTFDTLPGTDKRFVAAVRDALLLTVFTPAELSNGRRVRQLMIRPFDFDIR